jgi:flagellar basal-body rod protein FlgC
VVFASQPADTGFGETLKTAMDNSLQTVEVTDVIIDSRPPKMIYDPGHPDANTSGYVAVPDINVMEEMVNILSATRSYEANVAVVNATKSMVTKALEIGR